MRPRARRKRLVIRRLGDETLVYDLDSHEAHCLNRAADAVWRLCDGRHTLGDIARALKPASPDTIDPDVLRLALRELQEARLLADTGSEAALPAGPSRRDLLLRLGKGVAALPLVASVVAPTPAQAATPACPFGGPVDVNLCKSDDPIYLGCCCTDKGNVCIQQGANQNCSGAVC